MPRKKNEGTGIIAQKYPPVPPNAKPEDLVQEYHSSRDKNGEFRRALVGVVYCPKPKVEHHDIPFDPTTPEAQAALLKYADEIRKVKRNAKEARRRYLKRMEQT